MSHHIVEVTKLRHVYPDGTEALRGVSFRITHGESVAIIGANGAGKSTLLLHLNGHLIPTEGSVRIGDFPLTRATLPEIRRTVGMVFQNPDDQLFMPTVYDDVAFGPLNLGFPRDEVDAAGAGGPGAGGRCPCYAQGPVPSVGWGEEAGGHRHGAVHVAGYPGDG